MASARSRTETEHLRGYAICGTQRSGSNYLCQLLASTGILGTPLDFFNGTGRRAKGFANYPDDPAQQLKMILAHGVTANGIYGFKLFADNLEAMAPLDWTAQLPSLRWIHLSRRDLLGQALSLLIAKQTGQWRSTAPTAAAATYNADAIAAEMMQLARANARWQLYFARNGLAPLELCYEELVADPDATVRAIGSLMAIDAVPKIDRSLVDLEIQRNALTEAWREHFLNEASDLTRFDSLADPIIQERAVNSAQPAAGTAEAIDDRGRDRFWFPAIRTSRPRLTVSIITRNSATRLQHLLAETAEYADEILVGVDASSADNTLEIASSFADIIFRFRLRQSGQLAAARMLALQYATGDWILSLDDDEGMEPSFETLLPELLSASGITHYHLPRKWIVNEAPAEYLHAAPWFPNWALRLFRNDRSLVWKPTQPHTQYYVQGPGRFEDRTSILHFEPLLCAEQERREKIESYRQAGAAPTSEAFYEMPPEGRRRPVQLRTPGLVRTLRAGGIVHSEVHDAIPAPFAPWRSAIRQARIPDVMTAGESLLAEVTVANTGRLAWSPSFAQWPTREWPVVRLSYHLLRADGSLAEWEGNRTPVKNIVVPGDETTFFHEFTAPIAPGHYLVEWDMLHEGECWFAQCGGTVLRSAVEVVARDGSTSNERSISLQARNGI